jgi:hypothetical protein
MDEQNLTNVSGQQNVDDGVDYISAINEIKQNSVSKEAYDKLKKENKQLLDSLVSGKEIDVETKPVDVTALRKKLFNPDNSLSNLDYVSTALQLREALIEQGEPDPFLPVGEKVVISDDDIEKAENVASVLQDMVDIADGNNVVFNQDYQRRVVDSIATASKPNRRR